MDPSGGKALPTHPKGRAGQGCAQDRQCYTEARQLGQSHRCLLCLQLPLALSEPRMEEAAISRRLSILALGLVHPVCPSHLQLVGHQDDSLPPECLPDAFLKYMLAHVRIHGRQGVVQQIKLTVGVDGTSQADPLLLPPREVQTSLPNL